MKERSLLYGFFREPAIAALDRDGITSWRGDFLLDQGTCEDVEKRRKRLLVTGASGFLGWNACVHCRDSWNVLGVFHRHPFELQGVALLRADLTQWSEAKQVLREARPDVILHTAAASQPNFCQTAPERTRKINVEASCNLAGFAADRNIPFVFTSSDLVFDGKSPPYREEDPVAPLSVYGEQKVMAENGVLERNPLAAVCRLSLLFGNRAPASENVLESMVGVLRGGGQLRLFTDEFRTPLSVRDAVKGLLTVLGSVSGILHLGGAERISRYEFGRLLAEFLGEGHDRIVPCLRKDVPMPAPRPHDVSLDSSRAFSMGFKPGTLRGELEHLLREGDRWV